MRDQALLDRVIDDLRQRGLVAVRAKARSDAADLLVSHANGAVRIRVKPTRTRSGWLLSAPRAEDVASDLRYLFIDADDDIKYYVVPSSVVAKYVRERHAAWLKRPGRVGQSHNDSGVRHFDDPEHNYFNAWKQFDAD